MFRDEAGGGGQGQEFSLAGRDGAAAHHDGEDAVLDQGEGTGNDVGRDEVKNRIQFAAQDIQERKDHHEGEEKGQQQVLRDVPEGPASGYSVRMAFHGQFRRVIRYLRGRPRRWGWGIFFIFGLGRFALIPAEPPSWPGIHHGT